MNNKKNEHSSDGQINAAIKMACQRQIGVLDSGFLCQSVSILNTQAPLCVSKDDPLNKVLSLLREHKTGCVLVTNQSGQVVGIFSERDCILKITSWSESVLSTRIEMYMTSDPVTESPDCTIAFALTLMSQGGFRHIPIVDQQGLPIALLSVKEIVDFIVHSFTQDLLNFNTEL